MDSKVNRILQQKINLLSKQELEALGQSYIGKYAFVIYDRIYKSSKIKSYSFDIATQNGLQSDEDWRDRKKGDKTIYFTLENDEDWELVDIAVIGDTLNVRDASGGGYTNLEITNLTDTKIGFSDGRNFTFPISRTSMITPMLMDLGWLNGTPLPQMSTQQQVSASTTTQVENANLEGDFIGEFVNKNAVNLLELEKNNPQVFSIVEMTLNLLNDKFGGGKTVGEKVEEVFTEPEIVAGEKSNLIPLQLITIKSNEGKVDLKGQTFRTWEGLNDALKSVYDTSVAGYNKVTIKVVFENGDYFVERVYVGENEYNPFVENIGLYLERPFEIDGLNDDLDIYQWEDDFYITSQAPSTEVEDELSKEKIEAQVLELQMRLINEDDEERIKELQFEIDTLNSLYNI